MCIHIWCFVLVHIHTQQQLKARRKRSQFKCLLTVRTTAITMLVFDQHLFQILSSACRNLFMQRLALLCPSGKGTIGKFTGRGSPMSWSCYLEKQITSVREKKLIFGFDIRKKIKQFMDISAKVEAIAIHSMKQYAHWTNRKCKYNFSLRRKEKRNKGWKHGMWYNCV